MTKPQVIGQSPMGAVVEIEPVTTVPEVSKEQKTLERIQLLSSLAGGVQNESVKSTILALPCGQKLYDIFLSAVSQEIENLMNPQKAAPKEMMDAIGAAQNLKSLLVHMYNALSEMNRSQLIAVLSIMNQNLGGRSMPALPQDQSMAPMEPQAQPEQSGSPTRGRTNNTGITW